LSRSVTALVFRRNNFFGVMRVTFNQRKKKEKWKLLSKFCDYYQNFMETVIYQNFIEAFIKILWKLLFEKI
jgi:hypothetical protein